MSYTSIFNLDPDPAFVQPKDVEKVIRMTEANINVLASLETGKRLLESLKPIRIKLVGKPNFFLKGSDGKPFVYYDPAWEKSYDWGTVGPIVALGHELIHVWRCQQGALSLTMTPEERQNEENRTVGVAGFENEFPFTENKIRADLGLPKRPIAGPASAVKAGQWSI